MFILEDRSKQRVAVLLEEPGVMKHLIAGGEGEKYPMWSLVDDASPSWFSSDRMEQLAADLRRLKSPPEIALRQARWKRQAKSGIAWLEADLAAEAECSTPDETMSSVLGWMREAVRLAEREPPEFPESLREEAVVAYVDAIIALAQRCRQIRGFLGHDPFVNEV